MPSLRRLQRQENAKRLLEFSSKLTVEQKLARAAQRRGTSKKEIARLLTLIRKVA